MYLLIGNEEYFFDRLACDDQKNANHRSRLEGLSCEVKVCVCCIQFVSKGEVFPLMMSH